MIDFTNLPKRNKTYTGANGSKISVVYNNQTYMLKFPTLSNQKSANTSSCASEYIGCQIFESIGIPAQETLLGTYNVNGKEKLVVACKDFTSSGIVLQDFASLKNTILDTNQNGYSTELDDIIYAINEQQSVPSEELKRHFWDMFIVDALIGNCDRHNGNWGFLYNVATDEIKLAPIYDCGSCLYPQADEETMTETLNNKSQRDMRVFSNPLSAIKIKGRKINYFDFISSLQNKDCIDALKRIVPKIKMNEIERIIDETPYITDLQKRFYKVMIAERKTLILDFSSKKLFDKKF